MPRSAAPGRQARPKRNWAAIIPVSLGLSIASLLLFSFLADQVLQQGTEHFDHGVRSLIHLAASPWMTAVMRFATTLGDAQVTFTATLCLMLFFWYRGDADHLVLLLVCMTGAGVLDTVLKLAFHRARPDPFFIAKPTTYSFPSGHSLISLCFYGLLAGILSFEVRKTWQRVLIWCAAGFLIALIGLSRVYLGVHWPSDVLAGYAAGLIWMGAVRVLALRLEARRA
jgi:membrane-associated phospholipid phosphatase